MKNKALDKFNTQISCKDLEQAFKDICDQEKELEEKFEVDKMWFLHSYDEKDFENYEILFETYNVKSV